MTTKVMVTVRVKRKNGTVYSKDVETSLDPNKLRELGSINGANNLKAINLLFGNQFIGEEIIAYTGYRQL